MVPILIGSFPAFHDKTINSGKIRINEGFWEKNEEMSRVNESKVKVNEGMFRIFLYLL